MKSLLLAARIKPAANQAMVQDGGVLIDGDRIADVGDGKALRSAYPGAIVSDLGDVLLTPGLVNAHVHLELTNHHHGVAPASFVDWLLDLMGKSLDPAEGVAAGVAQCLKFGVTTVGDISRQCRATRPILADGPIRTTSFGEVQAMAKRRTLLEERFAAATDSPDAPPQLRVGVSPHAPYSIEPAGYERCLNFARTTGRPIATHLAETPEEREFLEHHTGPFARLWEALNAWDDQVPTFAGGPIRYAQSLGLLNHPTLLAHVNDVDDDHELDVLAAGQVSIAYCPRTHAYFHRPPHRWREMMARGMNVAVGTDSCASSPDLNLMDDLRLLHQLAPEVPVDTLFAMATTNAARAIGNSHVGALERGKFADVVAWKTADLSSLMENAVVPAGVWVGVDRNDEFSV